MSFKEDTLDKGRRSAPRELSCKKSELSMADTATERKPIALKGVIASALSNAIVKQHSNIELTIPENLKKLFPELLPETASSLLTPKVSVNTQDSSHKIDDDNNTLPPASATEDETQIGGSLASTETNKEENSTPATELEKQQHEMQELISFLVTLKNEHPCIYATIDDHYKAQTGKGLPDDLNDLESLIILNQHLSKMFESVEAFSQSLLERFILFIINFFSSDNVADEVEEALDKLYEQLFNLPIPTYKDYDFLALIESIARDYHNEVLTERYRNHIKERCIELIKEMRDTRCQSSQNQLGGDEVVS